MNGTGPGAAAARWAIRCEDVVVAYGRREVLSGVTLDLPAGVLVPVVGPNGAGKTTLLRAILGLTPPARGSIRILESRRPPAYVPQQGALDPMFPLTARDIVAMGLMVELGWWRRPAARHWRRVDGAIERMGLAEHQHKTFGELSGGLRQKVLLARALVGEPDLLVLDEPTSELDEPSERDVLSHLLRLVREEGRTVLLAHHGLEQAAALAERVCVVRHGRARLVPVAEARESLGTLASTKEGGGRHE